MGIIKKYNNGQGSDFSKQSKNLEFKKLPAQGSTFDRKGQGYSNEPYIIRTSEEEDQQQVPLIFGVDGMVRGGGLAPIAAEEDFNRIASKLTDSKNISGFLFVEKQKVLSKVSVKTPSSFGAGYSGGAFNQGIFNVNSLLDSVANSYRGEYIERQGLFQGGGINRYEEIIQSTLDDDGIPNNSRVFGLSRALFLNEPNNPALSAFQPGTVSGPTIYSYSNGPSSDRGVGITNLFYATNNRGAKSTINVNIDGTIFESPFPITERTFTTPTDLSNKTGFVSLSNMYGSYYNSPAFELGDLYQVNDTGNLWGLNTGTKPKLATNPIGAPINSFFNLRNSYFTLFPDPSNSQTLHASTLTDLNEKYGFKSNEELFEEKYKGFDQDSEQEVVFKYPGNSNKFALNSENFIYKGTDQNGATINTKTDLTGTYFNNFYRGSFPGFNIGIINKTNTLATGGEENSLATKTAFGSLKYRLYDAGSGNINIGLFNSFDRIKQTGVIVSYTGNSSDKWALGSEGNNLKVATYPNGARMFTEDARLNLTTHIDTAGGPDGLNRGSLSSNSTTSGLPGASPNEGIVVPAPYSTVEQSQQPSLEERENTTVLANRNQFNPTNLIRSAIHDYEHPNKSYVNKEASTTELQTTGTPNSGILVQPLSTNETLKSTGGDGRGTPSRLTRGTSKRQTIDFIIGIVSPNNPGSVTEIRSFEAYITELNESYSNSWDSFTYAGRNEKFYNFKGDYEKKISLGLKIMINSRNEAQKAQDIRRLQASMEGTYVGAGYPAGMLHTLTVGSYITNEYGILQNLSFNITPKGNWGNAPRYFEVKFDFIVLSRTKPDFASASRKIQAASRDFFNELRTGARPVRDIIDPNAINPNLARQQIIDDVISADN